jgi:hypothetical protein
MSTAPSSFHQWVIRAALLTLHQQIDARGLGMTIMAPIGVFMPAATRCSRTSWSWRRRAGREQR